MALIDALGADRREALRQLAGRIDASDDTAVAAWLAWQSVASLPKDQRQQAVSLFLAMEELRRVADGQKPMFKIVRAGGSHP